MSNAILLPMLLPLIGGVACLFGRKSLGFQRVVSGAISTALPLVCFWLLAQVRAEGVAVLRVGAWPGAFGIVFAVDLLGAIMLVLSSLVQAAAWWFIAAGALERDQETFLLHPLFLILCAGVNWAFSTGDLFNLFVSFEIVLLTSYVLISHGNERTQLRESLKYVVLNLVASTLFLVGAGYAYGQFGSLNMAELAVRVGQAGYPPEVRVLGTLLLAVFGMKAALFPMFFWLPDSYPKVPRGISAFFAGVLTKVGVYCLFRVFTLIFRAPEEMAAWFQPLLLALGGLTMVVGGLCALAQNSLRRIFSFSVISHVGTMIFALGLFTPLALAAGVFYVVHHILVKGALFLVGDAIAAHEGSDRLDRLSGLAAAYPGLALAFLLAAFSLAGIPPLSGFYGKYGLVVEGLREGRHLLVGVTLLTSLLTLLAVAKIWCLGFWEKRPSTSPAARPRRGLVAAATAAVLLTLVVAAASGWIMRLSTESAAQLLSRTGYVEAVLGARGAEALLASAQEAGQP